MSSFCHPFSCERMSVKDLFHAIRDQNLEEVKKVIALGVDVNEEVYFLSRN